MKDIIKYLCALILIVMVSATTVSVMTVKPATPKNVLVKDFSNLRNAASYIKDGYSRGYILKEVRAVGPSDGFWLVIMEKY